MTIPKTYPCHIPMPKVFYFSKENETYFFQTIWRRQPENDGTPLRNLKLPFNFRKIVREFYDFLLGKFLTENRGKLIGWHNVILTVNSNFNEFKHFSRFLSWSFQLIIETEVKTICHEKSLLARDFLFKFDWYDFHKRLMFFNGLEIFGRKSRKF